jgi:hypothetical protein
MSAETLILAVAIATAIHLARTRRELIAGVWQEARWYERLGLLAALLPIPGPVDELVGALVIRRVLARRGGR